MDDCRHPRRSRHLGSRHRSDSRYVPIRQSASPGHILLSIDGRRYHHVYFRSEFLSLNILISSQADSRHHTQPAQDHRLQAPFPQSNGEIEAVKIQTREGHHTGNK